MHVPGVIRSYYVRMFNVNVKIIVNLSSKRTLKKETLEPYNTNSIKIY